MSDLAFIPRTDWTIRDKQLANRAVCDTNGKLPNGRKRLCGAWTLYGSKQSRSNRESSSEVASKGTNPNVGKYSRLRCKCWGCSRCGPRKAKQYRFQILRAVDRAKLTRLFTLTLDPRNIATTAEAEVFYSHYESNKAGRVSCTCLTCVRIQRRAVPHIRECWNKLRVYLHRRFGEAPKYIAVLEFQKTTGLAHLHIVIDRYIEHAWAKNVWSRIGGGEHVHLRGIDAHRAAAYLSKYLSKELLLSAPEGIRRVTTSRSINFDKKSSEYQWRLLKSAIERFYVIFEKAAEQVLRDDEGELDAFVVRE